MFLIYYIKFVNYSQIIVYKFFYQKILIEYFLFIILSFGFYLNLLKIDIIKE